MAALSFYGTLCIISVSSKQIHCIPLKVALTPQERILGMMNVDTMNYALAFPYSDLDTRSFWMKNVRIPLDIVFLQKNVIQFISHETAPCKTSVCENVTSSADLVIELPGGWCRDHRVSVGDSIRVWSHDIYHTSL